MAADGLVSQGARASAAMILTWFSWNIFWSQHQMGYTMIQKQVWMIHILLICKDISRPGTVIADDLFKTSTHFISLAPGRSGCDSKNGIFYLVLLIGIIRSSHDNALWWMPQDLTDDKSTLVQVMAWCRQATSHYLSQCWLSSMLPYGVARPQWVIPSAVFKIFNKTNPPIRDGDFFKEKLLTCFVVFTIKEISWKYQTSFVISSRSLEYFHYVQDISTENGVTLNRQQSIA